PSKSKASNSESAVARSRRSTSAGAEPAGPSSVGFDVTVLLLAGGGDIVCPLGIFGSVGAVGRGRRYIRRRCGPVLLHHGVFGDDDLGIVLEVLEFGEEVLRPPAHGVRGDSL